MTLSDRTRYRRLRWFFLKVTLHIVWWDIVLNRPGLRYWRQPHLPRWQQLSRDYRLLAQELGGVLIKLGQFLSTRVDVLPAAVTDELIALQDRVPPVPLKAVVAEIEADFKRPLGELFQWLCPEPLGSASLAQAHRAQLVSGEIVVVKALRPGIEAMVEADLRSIVQAVKRLKFYKKVRRHVDLDRLLEEFVTVTQREIDMQAEGRSAERFAQDFAAMPQVAVPQIHWTYTAARTLTMEDVTYLKIDDAKAVEATGICYAEVAKTLFHAYMEQFFITHFIHCDPHPGNLFVKPLPHPEELERYGADWPGFRPGEAVPFRPDRPFQLVFIDFGMTVSLPPWLRAPLREYMMGVGTGDAQRIVDAYVAMGAVRPDADLARLEALTEAILAQFDTTLLGQLNNVDLDAFNKMFQQQYQDLAVESAVQFRSELLFVTRACGMLSGLLTQIDANFDSMAEGAQFTERLLHSGDQDQVEDWVGTLINQLPIMMDLGKQTQTFLSQANRGRLTIQTRFSPEAQNSLKQVQQSINRQTWVFTSIGLLLTSAIWHVGNRLVAATGSEPPYGAIPDAGLIILAIVCFVWGMYKTK